MVILPTLYLGLVLGLSGQLTPATTLVSTAPIEVHADPRATYLERAALYWMALPDCDRRQEACAAFERQEGEPVSAVRNRIATVSQQVSEMTTTVQRGLLLMSLAMNESRFRGYVDAGECNKPEFRSSRLARYGHCDNGHAFSLWQVHPNAQFDRDGQTDREMLTTSRSYAIGRASGIVDASLARDGTLRGYTGETSELAPKAFKRLRDAEVYLAGHPFKE